MSVARFIVEGQPPTWKRTNLYRGRHITPKHQREYQKLVLECWQRSRDGAPPWPLEKRYSLTVSLVPKDRRRADLDNYVKNFCDSLNGHAWNDDSQIDRLHIERREPAKDAPRVIVEIRTIDEVVL